MAPVRLKISGAGCTTGPRVTRADLGAATRVNGAVSVLNLAFNETNATTIVTLHLSPLLAAYKQLIHVYDIL